MPYKSSGLQFLSSRCERLPVTTALRRTYRRVAAGAWTAQAL